MYDPVAWAKLFKRSGAKWALLTSKHHDGFELWPSPQASSNFPQFGNGWNSAKLGPKRDLLGDFMAALRQEGLRAGFYHSLFEWYNPLYRGSDPSSYVTTKLLPDLKQLVEQYKPDDLLVDGEWEHPSDFWQTKAFLAWVFNESSVKDTIAVNDRWGNECRGKHGGYYTCENGGYSDFCNASYGGPAHPVSDHPWVYWATTCPQGSWGFSDAEGADDYQTAEYFTRLLIASVVDGGACESTNPDHPLLQRTLILLVLSPVVILNLGPTHRGTIPAVQQRVLLGIGSWLEVNGEAIYNSSPRERGFRREDEAPRCPSEKTCTFGFPFAGLNNVYGVKPGQPQDGILFLGNATSPAECQSFCAAVENDGCSSFTWHQPNPLSNYSWMCYGRTDSVWAPVPESGHVSGRRGDSVFSSAVQYTTSNDGKVIYGHFDTWPADGQLVLKRAPLQKVSASLLGVAGSLHTSVGNGALTIELPHLEPEQRPCEWSWVVKLEVS